MLYKNTNKTIANLQQGLSHYGLQPIDWKIVKKDCETYHIHHKDEDDFYFIGKTHPQKNDYWQKIILAGI